MRILGNLWLYSAALIICIGAVGVWYADSFLAMTELFSPFNVFNFIAVVITVAPAYGLLTLADKLDQRKDDA